MTKLSSRERILSFAVGGMVFVLLNLVLLNAFARKNITLRAELAQGRADEAAMRELLSQQDLWAKRDAWLNARQPRLTNEGAAGVELLDNVSDIAKKADLTVENRAIGVTEKTQWARSVSVTLDSHSTWPNLIKFLQAIQAPDQFIVFENAHIEVDAADPTRMTGHFKIARWYAL
jgi:hypothetical protein